MITDGLFNYVKSSYRLFLAVPLMNDDRCASTSAFLDEATRGGASASSTPAEPATK